MENQHIISDTYKLTNLKIQGIANECKRIMKNNGNIFKKIGKNQN